jgi:hypothetical protein
MLGYSLIKIPRDFKLNHVDVVHARYIESRFPAKAVIQHHMDRIHNLPSEILEWIFLKGCEDDVGRSQDHARQLKPFAKLVTTVCSTWRQVILDPGKFQNTHFYIAVLSLNLHFEKPEDSSFPRSQRLVRNLAQFKRALSETCGCDIEIKFSTDCQADSIEMLSEEVATQLKLFLNGMLSIIPYQRQILSLTLYADQPQAIAQVWQILDTPLREAHRLVKLMVYRSDGRKPHPGLERYNYEVEHTFRPMLNSPPYVSSGSVKHLVNLDSLRVDDLYWFEDPRHTTMATRLNISLLSDMQKLLDIFRLQPDLPNNLTWLEISNPFESSDPTEKPVTHRQQILFPRLRNLYLSVDDVKAETFLKQTHCPIIETICLWFSKTRGDEPRVELAKSWGVTSVKRQSLQNLHIFDFSLPISWTSALSITHVLKAFEAEHLVIRWKHKKRPVHEAALRGRILKTLSLARPAAITRRAYLYRRCEGVGIN